VRKCSAFIIVVTTIGLFAAGAWAEEIHQLGSHSASEVKKACDAAGGDFGIQDKGSRFGCTKNNCDGKGGKCGVYCSKGGNECQGITPAKRTPGQKWTLNGVLKFSPAASGPPRR
jgi:hypothetical protein